jgi:hypothetical protein
LYAGVTVTNGAPFVILFTTVLAHSGRPLRRVPRDAALVTAAMIAVLGLVVATGAFVAREKGWSYDKVRNHARNYWHQKWHKVPTALLDTFSPSALETIQFPRRIQEANLFSTGGRDLPGIVTAPGQSIVLVGFVIALTLSGAAGCLQAGGSLRALGAASLGMLAFHMSLHSLWGDAFFLYSQHWLIPLALLLTGNLARPGRVGQAFSVLYAAVGAAMFFHNGSLLNEMLTILGRSSL